GPGRTPLCIGRSRGIGYHSTAVVVLSICFLLGFPGNIAVIILKPNWENMSSLTQSLMLNLAVSGLLCMFTIPFWIYSFLNSWTLGLVGCKIITYFGYCSIYASLLTVTVMSVQRYFQVVYLQRNLNHIQAWKLLVPLWLVAMILSIPALVVRQLVEQSDWTYCKHQYYSVNQSMAVLITNLLCLVTLPIWTYYFVSGWIFGLVFCKLITYFVYCSIYGSLLTVTVLSIQRYLQVVHLERSLPQGGVNKLLVPLWLATLVGSVSLSVIVFSYISLYRKVNRAAFFNNPQTTRLITSIIVTFVALWVPYLAINVLSLVAISLNIEGLLKFCEDSSSTVGALTFLNSTMNPLLYAFTSIRLSTLFSQCVTHTFGNQKGVFWTGKAGKHTKLNHF
uniref:G-protein coupled receptors family 1 profile domain-containing protein n=1 Tax=Haplochromis burtoni TaxID=8153 RepID=A0A3Q2WW63_HAPBU